MRNGGIQRHCRGQRKESRVKGGGGEEGRSEGTGKSTRRREKCWLEERSMKAAEMGMEESLMEGGQRESRAAEQGK